MLGKLKLSLARQILLLSLDISEFTDLSCFQKKWKTCRLLLLKFLKLLLRSSFVTKWVSEALKKQNYPLTRCLYQPYELQSSFQLLHPWLFVVIVHWSLVLFTPTVIFNELHLWIPQLSKKVATCSNLLCLGDVSFSLCWDYTCALFRPLFPVDLNVVRLSNFRNLW